MWRLRLIFRLWVDRSIDMVRLLLQQSDVALVECLLHPPLVVALHCDVILVRSAELFEGDFAVHELLRRTVIDPSVVEIALAQG